MRSALTIDRQRGRHGFTLLEILMATVIFAAILAALHTVLYGALRLQSRTEEALDRALPIGHITSLLKRDLSQALPPGGLFAGPLLGTVEQSGNVWGSRLECYTTTGRPVPAAPWGDIQKVTYFLRSAQEDPAGWSGQGPELVRALTRNLLPSTEQDWEEQVLLRGLSYLEFAYYDGVEWQETWDATAAAEPMPRAVRARIEWGPSSTDARQVSRTNPTNRANTVIEWVIPLTLESRSSAATEGAETGPSGPGGGQNQPSPPSGGQSSGSGVPPIRNS